MRIFYSDLDNTLIYSYKHEIGRAKRCAEIYQGREISFMTEKTHRLLRQTEKLARVVPVTTRTEEQYDRIDLGIEKPPCALVCNGGVLLLENGKEDASWYEESLRLVSPCQSQLAYGETLLTRDPNRCFEVRNIRSLFLFTKSKHPPETLKYLEAALDPALVNLFSNGVKIYIVPKPLTKGTAIQRFGKRINPDYTISAGDSEFDIPMFRQTDLALAPKELKSRAGSAPNIIYMQGSQPFSEQLLTYIKDVLSTS